MRKCFYFLKLEDFLKEIDIRSLIKRLSRIA